MNTLKQNDKNISKCVNIAGKLEKEVSPILLQNI